jgi:hypothetical protein
MTREDRRAVYLAYLQMKIFEKDWHGVQDGASDLRDLESEERGAREARAEEKRDAKA